MGWCQQTSSDNLKPAVFSDLGGPVSSAAFIQSIAEAFTTAAVVCFARHFAKGGRREGGLVLSVYWWILFGYSCVSVVHAIKLLLVGNSISDGTYGIHYVQALEGICWGAAHVVIEGSAFLLCQPGAGKRSFIRASVLAVLWGLFTAVVVAAYISDWHEPTETLTIVGMFCWEGSLCVVYGVLWLAPVSMVYRRPALLPFARYSCLARSILFVGLVLQRSEVDVGYCITAVSDSLLFSIGLPLCLLLAMHRDSLYWQGMFKEASSGGSDRLVSSVSALLEGSCEGAAARQTSKALAKGIDSSVAIRVLQYSALQVPESDALLGAGGTAKVLRGRWRDQDVAIKILTPMDLTPDVIQGALKEAELLSRLKHPGVVHIHGVCLIPPSICLVLEHCAHGALFEFLQQQQVMLPWPERIAMMKQATAGVAFLHSRGVVHADVKSLNFLVDDGHNIKLADLGESRFGGSAALGHGTCSRCCGWYLPMELDAAEEAVCSMLWTAPEVLQGLPPSPTADVYSLAIVLFEIASQEEPYANIRSISESVIKGLRPSLPCDCPIQIKLAIEQSWSKDPTCRLSASKLGEMLALAAPEMLALDQEPNSASRLTTGGLRQLSGFEGVEVPNSVAAVACSVPDAIDDDYTLLLD